MTHLNSLHRFTALLLLILWLCITHPTLAQQVNQPQTLTEWLQAASDDVAAQNYDEARNNYAEAEKLAETDEQKAVVRFSVATVDLVQSRFAEAEVKFQLLVADKATPDYLLASVKMSMGQAYAGGKKYAQARAVFQELIDDKENLDASKVSYLINIGLTYLAEEKYQEAKSEFDKIKSYSASVPTAEITSQVWTGKVLVLENKWDEARAVFSRALQTDAESFKGMDKTIVGLYQDQARLQIAVTHAKQGNTAQAQSALQELIARPKVAAQVLIEAKRQLKMLQPTDGKEEKE